MVCPGCGSCHFQSNLIDEAPFAEAALHAPQLRHFGSTDMAAGVLGALCAVKIANFLRLKWRCSCGVRFDG